MNERARKLRERVAKTTHEQERREGQAAAPWDAMPETHQDMYREEASEVLRAVVEEIGEPVAWRLKWAGASVWDRHRLTASEPEAHAWGDHDPKGREQGFYRAVPLHDLSALLEASGER